MADDERRRRRRRDVGNRAKQNTNDDNAQLTCRTCLNCSSKLQPLFGCDELEVSLDVDEFEPAWYGTERERDIVVIFH